MSAQSEIGLFGFINMLSQLPGYRPPILTANYKFLKFSFLWIENKKFQIVIIIVCNYFSE